jgi:hypothetical protein
MNMKARIDTKNKSSAYKKLIPAAGSLLISAAMLSTSTFAWFTMNKTVTVTGMTMNTKVSENLLIADDAIDNDEIKADNLFNNSLVQLVDGLIEPVSTVDGKTFYYTAGTNVQGNGAVLNKTWAEYDPDDTSDFAAEYALSGADATAAKGYVDYVYQLKAINGSTASEIRLTGLNLTYGGTEDNDQLATRIAVFAENLGYKTGADDSTLDAPAGNMGATVVKKAIYTIDGAANFSKAEGEDTALDDAVNSTTTRADVTYNEKFTLPVGTNQTQYYRIVVRVWLEGEDTTCNNTTFMDLTDKWSVDMQWDLVATATADSGDAAKVDQITNAVSTGKVALTTSQTVAGTAAYTISGTPYYALTGKTLDGEQLYIRETALATTSQVFTISANGLYPTDVTNQVTITAGT